MGRNSVPSIKDRQAPMERKAKHATLPISVDRITQSILILRGHKVLLDTELAALYGVETGC
jgi:hypothetical protein